jgi:integrase
MRVTLYKREDSPSWQARWWDASARCTRRKSLKTADLRLARQLAREIEQGLSAGHGPGVPLPKLARAFLLAQRGTVSKLYHENQSRQVGRFLLSCRKPTAEVRVVDVRRFLDSLKLAPATVNSHRRSLLSMFRMAEEREWIVGNPARAVRPKREPQKLFTYLTPAEKAHVLASCPPRLLLPVSLALFAGLRRGEVCALRWADVNLRRRVLLVRHSMNGRHLVPLKNRREREVPIASDLQALLKRKKQSAYVCVSGRSAWLPLSLGQAVRRFGARLGFEDLNGLHILRRTFATLLVTAGEPMAQVSEWLGHSSVSVTERRYARFMPGKRGRIDEI